MKIKKPVVNYLKLCPSNVNTPEYKHVWLLLGWVWYLTMFVLTERFISPERCHVVHSFMDDVIPFHEGFIIFYDSWYVLLVGTIAYFLFYDVESFVRVQKFIILTQIIGVAAYLLWPSVQYLRPTTFPRDNFCTKLVQAIYGIDTPTGVCPSLHVGYALAIFSAWQKKDGVKLFWKIFLAIWVFLICISVCFVKQHSFTDVWTATLMCAFIEVTLFGRYWTLRIRGFQERMRVRHNG